LVIPDLLEAVDRSVHDLSMERQKVLQIAP
jgi:hypothetical protein